jgi:endonuclease/exonuclease/phosphatase family metal-dependent hydrolase
MAYSIITYNDGDNATTRVNEITTILAEYDPDLFGLQETQEIHMPQYAAALPAYDYVYFDNDGTTYNSQPIFFKREKFELLESGIKWLSDTPDVRSRFPESAYTRSFTYALLRDKATDKRFLMANTHIDYTAAGNPKQVARLVELTREMYPDVPAFYTADWNMYRTSEGYAILEQNGMIATEEFVENAVKAPSFEGGTTIDFCFVDRRFFKGTAYHVIDDHKYSKTASDHFPVYTEIEFI